MTGLALMHIHYGNLDEIRSVVLVCDRTSSVSYSMFFKAILKFKLVLVIVFKAILKF